MSMRTKNLGLARWRRICKMVREIYPNIPKTKRGRDYIGYLIWNHTGYPNFFRTDDPLEEMRQSLIEYRDCVVDEYGIRFDDTATRKAFYGHE